MKKVVCAFLVVVICLSVEAAGQEYYNLTIDTNAGGYDGGTVSVPGIGTYVYPAGTIVDLNAIANVNWYFWKWTGDTANVANTTAPDTTITINADAAVTANFTFSCQEHNFTRLVNNAADNAVTVADMNLMITYINTYKTGSAFAVGSANPNWLPNGPIFNLSKKMGGTDDVVNIIDLNLFITFVNNRKTGTTFSVNCATCGC